MRPKGTAAFMDAFDTIWPRPRDAGPACVIQRVVEGRSGVPCVLVGMLYSGESQVTQALMAVARQSDTCIDIAFFTGFGNREGHEALYGVFTDAGTRYDFYLKLDADMVLLHSRAIADTVAIARELQADELLVPVHDWLSDQPIYGAHLFAPGMRWNIAKQETRFVDPRPVNASRRCIVPLDQLVFAQHNAFPSEGDAYAFGVHRGGKMMQYGAPVSEFRCHQARGQFQLARQILTVAKHNPDRRRYLSLIGFLDAISGHFGEVDYRQMAYSARATKLFTLPDETLRNLAVRPWTPLNSLSIITRSRLRCGLARVVRLYRKAALWASSSPRLDR